jgi:hypothetical protein
MSGLDAEQLDDLEQMVGELLKKPWDQRKGRPRELTLREALIVTSGYMRQNITEEVWAEIFDVNQSTISRYITFLTPLIDQVTAEFRPSAEQAVEATRGAIALVDGTLWPCWSWARERELWAGKCKTTGHGSLIVANLVDRITFVSEPVPGTPVGRTRQMRRMSLSMPDDIFPLCNSPRSGHRRLVPPLTPEQHGRSKIMM